MSSRAKRGKPPACGLRLRSDVGQDCILRPIFNRPALYMEIGNPSGVNHASLPMIAIERRP
jgi:hypothetical protein